MANDTGFTGAAKAWVKRQNGKGEIVQVAPDPAFSGAGQCYQLYTAFGQEPDGLGRILFDEQGYWIYDGDVLSIAEQEQLARFIMGKESEWGEHGML